MSVLTFKYGYLNDREMSIFGMRRKRLRQVTIGKTLGVSRQAVHKTLNLIDNKIERAFTEVSESNNLEVKSINLVDGIMVAHSPAYRIPVIVSISQVNGLRVWYLYEGQCDHCSRYGACQELLLDEAKERGIHLSDEKRKQPPTELALRIFSRYIEEKDNVQQE